MPKSFTATDLLNAGRQRPGRPAEPPEQPGDMAPSRLGDVATSRPVGSTTSRAVAESTKPDGVATYQRMTVFLTSEQRRWIKDTARGLPVDGLSASDLVRLAVTHLHQQVDAGLPLLEALTAQAHQEAACHPGRKHRGLPPAL